MPSNLRQHQSRPVVANTTAVGVGPWPAGWPVCEFAFLCHPCSNGKDGVCVLGLGCSPLTLTSANQERQPVQQWQPTGQHEEQPEGVHGGGPPMARGSGTALASGVASLDGTRA